jgi:hypothetical protein
MGIVMTDVSIIVLNWNGLDVLEPCLDAVKKRLYVNTVGNPVARRPGGRALSKGIKSDMD